MKSLILLASVFTYRFDAFEQAAERLGIPVVRALDVPPPLLGKSAEALAIDYRDIPRAAAAVVRYARDHPIGAVLGLDDSGTLIAAEASQRLGLRSNDPGAVLAARDKGVMRRRFAAAGIPSPAFQIVSIHDDPAAVAERTNYPCVLKPTSLSGSQGVMRANSPEEFLNYHRRLTPILQANRCTGYLVEEYLPGAEVALEGLLDEGRLHVLALFDKPDPLEGPFFEETIYTTPSRLPLALQQSIVETAARAAEALGLQNGPIHAELRLPPGGPAVIEVAARSIGGHCSQTLRFSTDVSLEELILRQAYGLPFASQRESLAGGVMMIPIPAAGILVDVGGLEEARRAPLIESIEIAVQPIQKIVPLPEGGSYLGFIIARGDTPQEVEEALRRAHRLLHLEIAPAIAVWS